MRRADRLFTWRSEFSKLPASTHIGFRGGRTIAGLLQVLVTLHLACANGPSGLR